MVRSISRAWGLLGAVAVIGSWSTVAAQNPSAIPDLSGVWGRNTIDYSAPATGKGPIKNISGSRNVMVGDYNDPMLKPWAAEIVKRNGEIAKTGDAFPTAHNQCWPEPPPYILGNQQLQVLQQKDQALLMYSHGSQVRHVRLNATHPAKVTPSWYGDSIGHYEGDTLVVDTIGYKLGPYPVLDMFGSPFSEALHVTERYRMIDYEAARAAQARNVRDAGPVATEQAATIDENYKGKGLQIQFTVEDKKIFNTPWSAA